MVYSGALNDLFALDPSKMRWTNLTAAAAVLENREGPSPRGYPGLAVAVGRIFVFGGIDGNLSE